ncbi:hypothetical protein QYF61_013581, partial [Mycteria americana]
MSPQPNRQGCTSCTGHPPPESHLAAASAAHPRTKRCSCNSWLDKECIYFCHLDIIWVNTPGHTAPYGLGSPPRRRKRSLSRCECSHSRDNICATFCQVPPESEAPSELWSINEVSAERWCEAFPSWPAESSQGSCRLQSAVRQASASFSEERTANSFALEEKHPEEEEIRNRCIPSSPEEFGVLWVPLTPLSKNYGLSQPLVSENKARLLGQLVAQPAVKVIAQGEHRICWRCD